MPRRMGEKQRATIASAKIPFQGGSVFRNVLKVMTKDGFGIGIRRRK